MPEWQDSVWWTVSWNLKSSQTYEHSNLRGCIWIWNSVALLHDQIKMNSIWESLIFHYRTCNDYYLPSLLLKLFYFFFLLVKNLFVLFKQHLFCQNVLTDFSLIDFFFFPKAWTWHVDLQLFPSIPFLIVTVFIQGRNQTKSSSFVCAGQHLTGSNSLDPDLPGESGAETHHEPCITTQLGAFYWTKLHPIF